MTIHTFGDSHAHAGWSCLTGVVCHSIGPVLCYSIGVSDDRLKLHRSGVIDGDVVVFCFGEIDCRCHVHKYVPEGRSHESVIDEIVDKYLRAIQRRVQGFFDITVCVYNVPPTIHRKGTRKNPEYPHLGTDEERRTYVEYFNSVLRRRCPEVGYVFFDIYDKCTDADGFLAPQISDGVVHIADATIIGNFLNRLLDNQRTKRDAI